MQYWQRKLQRSVTGHAQIADPAAVPVDKRIHRHAPSVSCRAMRLAALLLCGALTLAACGGGGDPERSDADRVRDTLGAFGEASARHDYRRVCAELLAKPVIDSVRRAGLSLRERDEDRPARASTRRRSRSARSPIKGNRASAKVHTTAANQPASDDTVALVREGGDWKIGALAGVRACPRRARGPARAYSITGEGEAPAAPRRAAPALSGRGQEPPQ